MLKAVAERKEGQLNPYGPDCIFNTFLIMVERFFTTLILPGTNQKQEQQNPVPCNLKNSLNWSIKNSISYLLNILDM